MNNSVILEHCIYKGVAPLGYDMAPCVIVDCGRSSSVVFSEIGLQYDIRPLDKEFSSPWWRLNQYKKRDIPYASWLQ